MPFGKYLPQKAVGVLVRAALPRALRIAKIDLDVSGPGRSFVWVGTHRPAGDLLWRPLLLQPVRHLCRQRGMQHQRTSLGAVRPVQSCLIRIACSILCGAAVT